MKPNLKLAILSSLFCFPCGFILDLFLKHKFEFVALGATGIFFGILFCLANLFSSNVSLKQGVLIVFVSLISFIVGVAAYAILFGIFYYSNPPLWEPGVWIIQMFGVSLSMSVCFSFVFRIISKWKYIITCVGIASLYGLFFVEMKTFVDSFSLAYSIGFSLLGFGLSIWKE